MPGDPRVPAPRLLSRRLSALDAAFLYADTEEGPLNIGGVSVFDGPLSRSGLLSRLRERLPEIPRYRQRVIPAPFGLGHPFWEDDPRFDPDGHVFEVHLRAPDESTLQRAVEAVFEGKLRPDRPLWQLWLIHGLEGDRSALVSKIHHAMVDGVSGVELFEVLFDLTPDGRRPPRHATAQVHPPSTTSQRFAEASWDAAHDLADTGLRAVGALTRLLSRPRETLASVAAPLAALATSGVRKVARLPFNRPLSGRRRVGWATLSLAELRGIRSACGGTLNDVALAIVGDAVGGWLRERGWDGDARMLRALVPVDIRRPDEVGQLGNRVSIVPVEIDLLGTPADRLAGVRSRTQAVKQAAVAEWLQGAAAAAAASPALLYSAALSLAARPDVLAWSSSLRDLSALTANIVCTNVAGPQVPMYAQGRLLTAHYPIVPLAFEFGLSFAVFSYNQRLFVGVIADAAAVDDLEPLVRHLERAGVELREAAGVAACPPVDVNRRSEALSQGASRTHGVPTASRASSTGGRRPQEQHSPRAPRGTTTRKRRRPGPR